MDLIGTPNSMTMAPAPRKFQTSSEHVDGPTAKCSVPLRRVIAKPNWADQHGLTGKYVDEVSIIDLLYRKWDEAALRYLTQETL